MFHIPKTGVSGARNYGIERAKEKKPEYIYFLDSDDWLECDMLEKLYDAAVSNNADVAVCGWNIEFKWILSIFYLEQIMENQIVERRLFPSRHLFRRR